VTIVGGKKEDGRLSKKEGSHRAEGLRRPVSMPFYGDAFPEGRGRKYPPRKEKHYA